MPLVLQILPLLVSILQSPLLVHRGQQQLPLLVLLDLHYTRIGIVVGPLDSQHLVAIEGLVSHGLLGKLSHASMIELDESISLVRQDVDVLHFPPDTEMSQQHLVHLSHSVLCPRQSVLTHIEGFGLLCETADALHVLPETAKP